MAAEQRQHGPWTIQATSCKYQNDFIEVNEDRVIQPDGQPGAYATARLHPGVGILPIDEDGSVYLVRQFRYALGSDSLEVVAGTMEEDEEPLAAARREAREELGLEAEEWTDVGLVNLETSVVYAPAHMFIARKLTLGQPKREGTEQMETVKMSLAEAIGQVMSGGITGGLSCVLLLKAAVANGVTPA